MASSRDGGKKKVRRENTVILSPSLREKLTAWVDSNRPLKLVASELGCTEKWLWNLRNHHGSLDKNLVIGLCKMAGIPYGPQKSQVDDFQWIPAEENDVKWALSYEAEGVGFETRLTWREWHEKGYWAIVHRGLVCGFCECLSMKAEVIDKFSRGEIVKTAPVSREMFEDPPWPTRRLLIHRLMIVDRSTNKIEASPLAMMSILANLPPIIERCVGANLSEANVYALPTHFQTIDTTHLLRPVKPAAVFFGQASSSLVQMRKASYESQRLLLKLGFAAVETKLQAQYPLMVVKAAPLLERLKQMREAIRHQ